MWLSTLERQITGIFAGDMLAAHAQGCDFVKENAMVEVEEPYDVVITTNSGYPLDQNLYQSVKGMSAASQIVREGGAIIMAAACEDGLPDHGRVCLAFSRSWIATGRLDLISSLALAPRISGRCRFRPKSSFAPMFTSTATA